MVPFRRHFSGRAARIQFRARRPKASVTINACDSIEPLYRDVPLTTMRKVIAKRLTASKQTVPHLYAQIDCLLDPVLALRQQWKAQGLAITLNDVLLAALGQAFLTVPIHDSHVDVAFAVATPQGLITPIIPNISSLSLQAVHDKVTELIEKARQGRLQPAEFQGGHCTLSNLGSFGIDSFTAVINPPQSCILAVGQGQGQIGGTTLRATLSADRRFFSDALTGQFLQAFQYYLQQPNSLSI